MMVHSKKRFRIRIALCKALEPTDMAFADTVQELLASSAPKGRSICHVRKLSTWQMLMLVQQGTSHDDQSSSEDDNDGFGPSPHMAQTEVRAGVVKQAWDNLYSSDELLLFSAKHVTLDLAPFHPQSPHIFKLWQVYLDNANPLLKVTHTPTLQTRIINAASNLSSVEPVLEALMFSIYCIAMASLTEDECQVMFGSAKAELERNYRFGCQQALLNCHFLRTDDRECLVAYVLYLVCLLSLARHHMY